MKKGPRWDPFFHSLARPERFELPTSWFVAMHSIQLSYGRVFSTGRVRFRPPSPGPARLAVPISRLAEREGFEPSMSFWPILP